MFEAYGLTDRGCVRSNNEDYFIADSEAGIFILADGMGGANAGEYAAQLSSERLYETLLHEGVRGNGDHAILDSGFRHANSAVREAARVNPDLRGMGTTLIAARVLGVRHLEVGSIGDSRAYLCADRGLRCITRDNTWVAEVGERLGLDDRALKTHPMRHVLTLAIGTAENVQVHSQVVTLLPRQQLLLCSDGLHGVLPEDFLLQVLLSEKNLAEKAHYLVDAAKDKGGPDNITVILICAN